MSTDQESEQDLEPAAPHPLAPSEAPPTLLPADYGPELAERLVDLDRAAALAAAQKRPANTRRAYASDWKAWVRFTEAFGVPVTAAAHQPGGRGLLRTYVAWLWEQGGERGRPLAPTTIDRRLAGLAVTLRREYGTLIPPEYTETARELLKDLKKEAKAAKESDRGRGQAPALRLESLRAIARACPDTLSGLRDRFTVLLAFTIAARRHEAAALFGRDLVLVEEGMLVNVEVSKTHPRQVAVPYSSDPVLCPVRTWLEWKEAAGIEPDTPALRRMHRTGSVTRAGLSPQSVGTIITEAGQRAGLNVRFTGHSARRGFITESARAKKDRKAIAKVSGHVDGSRALEGYIELANRFGDEENAIKGIM
ncbi:tyrosine-type recombinase/integrase [Nocardiopsis aegyptia]|uniref:tyrosine-type recombinase/integrase n=1 Tax=Nocardiopsis aegyptia TaxID=220378 RepID=UPI00366BF9A9